MESNCHQCKAISSKSNAPEADSVSGRRVACWKCTRKNTTLTRSNHDCIAEEKPVKMSVEMSSDTPRDSNDVEKTRAYSSYDFTDPDQVPKMTVDYKRRYSDNVRLKRYGSVRQHRRLPDSFKDVVNVDGITDLCDNHAGKVMEYYCTNHLELLCSVCMSLNHIECTNKKCVEYIPNFVKREALDINLKETIVEISELTKLCREKKDNTTQKISKVIDLFNQVTEEIKGLRKRINKLIDGLEDNILKETKLLKDQSTERFMKKCDQFEATVKELKNINFELVKCQQSQNDAQSFVIIKKAEKEIKKQKRSSRVCYEEDTVPEYFFEAEKNLETLLDSINSFGKLKKRQQLKSVDIKRDGVLNVRSKDDMKESWVTGLTVMSDSRILIADYDNQMTKLIDTKYDLVLSSLRLPSRPHDVAKFKTHKSAITLPDRQKIVLISLHDDEICVERSISVSGRCYGIATSPDGNCFILTMLEPARIQIIRLDGSQIREITNVENDTPLFSCPEYVSVSKDGNRLYVSDYDRDSVTVLSIEGKVQRVFKSCTDDSSVLEGPKAVYASDDGYVYVCGSDSNNILMFTDDCEKYTEVLTRADGIENPVCFGEVRTIHNTCMYVNCGQNTLRIFDY